MVASKKVDAVGVFDFVAEEDADAFDGVVSTVDVVAKVEVSFCLGKGLIWIFGCFG